MKKTYFVRLFALLAITLFSPYALSQPTQPSFTKTFTPDTIGPGSISVLEFTIDNTGAGTAAEELDFTDNLPGEITLATPAAASSNCLGTLTASDGGSVISLAGGAVAANSVCKIQVNVTAAVVGEGPYTNTTGDLTSTAGNSGTAMADLTVDDSLPGFTKGFEPDSVGFRGRSTLTITIDNTTECGECAEDIIQLSFTDDLPPGMVVADPANASTDCENPLLPATLTADPGTSFISLVSPGTSGFPALVGEETCIVTVDVIGGALGSLGNVTSDLILGDGFGGSETAVGKAADILEVTGFDVLLQLTKEFTDDPVAPGGTTTLEFTITNKSRADAATGITFSDDLDSLLSGLTPILPSSPDPACGAGSSLDFNAGVLTLTGGSLPPESSCTFQVDLSVPGTSAPGTYTNSTSPVSGLVGGSPEEGNVAEDLLFVVSYPVLTKMFTGDPVGAGDSVTLEFTITNPETTSAMSDIAFVDELTDGSGFSGGPPSGFLPFPVSVALPPDPDPPCGPGSSLALLSLGTDRTGLELTGGTLAAGGSAGDSCTFSVMVNIPAGLASGTYTNTTEEISGVLDDFVGTPTVTGPGASDDIVVVGAPQLGKEFTDDPVAPGGTVTLEFTLSHDASAPGDATGISFTDNLAALSPSLDGLTATLPPTPDPPCGPGSSLNGSAGDTLLTFAGGTLAPGAECTFSVTLNVPATPPGGVFSNSTSDITATVAGVATTSPAPSDDLVVTGLLFSKEFTDDPAIPGGTTTLRFTLDNVSDSDASGIAFTDSLAAILPGTPDVTALGLPLTTCGGGTLSAPVPTLLQFTGGSVTSGMECSFDVTLMVPAAAEPGSYNSVTSGVSSNFGVSPPAVDVLAVNPDLLALTKEFTDDPVNPGDPVTLEFTLENLSATETVTDIAFDDDLDAALSGLQATAATFNDCGGMAAGFPAGLFEYSGGTLSPGASCTITLTVDVPAGPLSDSVFTNTTTEVSGKVGALDVTGNAASDDLLVQLLNFTKSFDGPTTATGTALLTFTINNLDSVNAAGGLSFSDDLDAVFPGLVATGLPAAPCGPGSTLAGTSLLTLNGGNLPASGMCSFDVTVTVPPTATAGTFPNTSSQLFSNGLTVADAASADLVIEPAPTFAKAFAPDSLTAGASTTLNFTVDNTASAVAATGLAFTDNFPAGLVIATPPNASTTCTGGTLTAAAGTAVLSYAGGTVAAGASCSVQVDTTGLTAGSLVNTSGDLTSSSGNSGTASDTFTVTANAAPLFSKGFTPGAINSGGTSQLLLTIDNTASTLAATGLAFTDNFPAGMVIASPPNASTTCTGGTVTAAAGATVFSYSGGTVSAGASCTVEADTTSSTVGIANNTSGDLTSSAGNSGPASDTLTVNPAPLVTSFTGPLPSGNVGTISINAPAPGCTFASNPVFSNPGTAPPPGVVLVDGVISFRVVGCASGATVSFTMDYGQTLDPDTKYVKEPSYSELPGAVVAGNTITFSITDGGAGDDDMMENQEIQDPGGAALIAAAPVEPSAIPVTSPLGLWVLAVLMLLVGLIGHRRFGY